MHYYRFIETADKEIDSLIRSEGHKATSAGQRDLYYLCANRDRVQCYIDKKHETEPVVAKMDTHSMSGNPY